MRIVSPQKGAKILVVDDVPENLILLGKQLEKRGYLVTCVGNGPEALELLSKNDHSSSDKSVEPAFDLVILDIVMPEVDGLTILTEFRKRWSPIEVPVIMVTARNRSDDIIGALSLGANDYVTKPIDFPVLLARLATQVDLKHSHKALREAQHSLIQAAKMETVGALAAGVAHEIRNPFAKILMASEGMARLECIKNDETGSLLAELMAEAVKEADLIVRRLMEFSNSSKLALEDADVNLLITETVELLVDELPDRIELDLKLSPNLKNARVAQTELQQVLINLIMNSVQAMPEEGGNVTITTGTRILEGLPSHHGSRSVVRLHNGVEACIIEIEDTGGGIEPKNIDKIFDAFFTTKPTGIGSGLGLTIARKVIDLHDGLIEVKNRTDRTGTKVNISLLPTDSVTGERFKQMI